MNFQTKAYQESPRLKELAEQNRKLTLDDLIREPLYLILKRNRKKKHV